MYFIKGGLMKTGYRVADAMTVNPVMLSKDISLQKCAKLMEKKHVGAVLVGDKENIEGLLTEQDIVRKIIGKGINPLEKNVGDFMERKLLRIKPEEDIFDALIIMRNKNIRHLPVFEGKKFKGLLTIKDILKIQPNLFNFMVEKFELKEEKRKPTFESREKEGICNICGNYSEEVFNVDETLMCKKCKKESS